MSTASQPAPRQERSRAKRDRILTTTAQLLAELPYEQIGTKLIAERSGVAIGSLYRYFTDKSAIVTALAVRWLDEMVGVLARSLADPPAELAALIDRIVEAYAEFWRQEPGFHQLWYGAVPGLRIPAETTDDNDEQLVSLLFPVLVARYSLPDGPAMRLRTGVAVTVTSTLLNEAFRHDPHGDPGLLAELKLLLRRYLTEPDR